MDAQTNADDLIEAAADGVEFDGLRLEARDDGYLFETPTLRRTGLSGEELRRTLAEFSAHVDNWRFWRGVGGEGTARRAFLRWCERAPLEDVAATPPEHPSLGAPIEDVPDRYEALESGIERTWGELHVTTRLDGEATAGAADAGTRTYRVSHVDDAGVAATGLESSRDPREARTIATYDETGRYRPLKTAPTLPDGWVFPALSAAELHRLVGIFYPATVANWHRELRGNLDVDHWLETAERQTGIYDVVDELPREALEWLTEACCVDSQCLKRREWQYEAGDEIAVDGGDGPFPCREPCSLVISAARKWAILESESEKTWEFELTTSEKNQLEALLDAVADGRIDEIREADLNDGANRYRARYLRAKRVDEDGNLCGVDSSQDD
ncbi:DR2241 family protein [Natrononativus amylolyticus]|uniref:DR2241 family protein n=1 Tax=Natrononativus amylolyticus TaxID=2963434 RepID=UPI0020CEE55E|nr:DR2241 family protein [Natrononativus amylolyticus]